MATHRKLDSALGDLGKGITPKSFRPHLKTYLQKAGINNIPYSFFAILMFGCVFASAVVFAKFVFPYIRGMNDALVGLISFAAIAGISLLFIGIVGMCLYFYYDVRIYKRTTEMESYLADYLQVVSTNLKGGMSFERSLFAAIRPEFGVLAQEIALTSKKVLTGHDLVSALDEFASKYNSPELRRSFNLITGEVTTGGKVAYVIDEVVKNLKDTQRLKAEMSASVITYIIFIGAIVVVIAPALFALSYNLLSFMAQFTDKLADTGVGSVNLPFSFSKGAIKPEYFQNFSVIATVLVSFFSAMIVSTIEKGNIKAGLKYIPIFVVSSFLMYQLFMFILGIVFASLVI